jgi:hypothetical protein
MNGLTADSWLESNKGYLLDALAEVRTAIEACAAKAGRDAGDALPAPSDPGPVEPTVARRSQLTALPPALETLCSAFGLSTFERQILLMCAGAELDSRLADLYAASQPGGRPLQPTFGLALAAFPDAHWSALSPQRPLRYWHLVELTGEALTTGLLRINERILHYLTGVPGIEETLQNLTRPLPGTGSVVPSHMRIAERIASLWARSDGIVSWPIITLCGDEVAGKRSIAAAAAAMLRIHLYALPARSLIQRGGELDKLLRSWEREAILSSGALLIECDDAEESEGAAGGAVTHVMETLRSPLLVCGHHARRCASRPVVAIDVSKPTAGEQIEVWRNALGPAAAGADGALATLVAQFNLDLAAIHSAARHGAATAVAPASGERPPLGQRLWSACRVEARPRLEGLAQRIEPAAGWDDLILPPRQKEVLHQVAVHVRHRAKVYQDWGFAAKCGRGLGISALFAGASGTGKTMAAEVLANELGLDLYRIDLSQVVSKYIGETEKNLRRVFDTAEGGAAVLLFDEADALFGKRTEVKDSHDRYANIEVSYLLQRMEAYRGLAILTTNRKNALDQAFLRRIRFVIEFPFPDAAQRAEIWRRVFPQLTPTQDLNIARLAQLNVAGGHIRNVAMGAAFLAADAGEPVRMGHLLSAARLEFAKLEKPLTDAEVAGWT